MCIVCISYQLCPFCVYHVNFVLYPKVNIYITVCIRNGVYFLLTETRRGASFEYAVTGIRICVPVILLVSGILI